MSYERFRNYIIIYVKNILHTRVLNAWRPMKWRAWHPYPHLNFWKNENLKKERETL
jgi:hypothetical protein